MPIIPSGNYAIGLNQIHWALYISQLRMTKYFIHVDGNGKYIFSSFMGILREGGRELC